MTIWTPDISRASGPKYLAIANAIASAISDGSLQPGEKLPPQRNLAYDLGVTLGTITRAYQEATRRGYVDGEVGRGTYVLEATTPAGNFMTGTPISANEMDFSLATPALGRAGAFLSETLAELSRAGNLDALTDYQRNTGHPDHLAAGASWISSFGLAAPVDQVAITNGAQQGIFLSLMTVARPGELILTEALTFPGVIHLANQLGYRLQGVAMDKDGIRPDALEEICRRAAPKALYTMPTLHNPTTLTMPAERRQQIAAVARKYDLFIIEDDIWGSLPESPPRPLSAYAPELSFYICGLSKCMAGGLRVGYVLAPPSRAQTLRGMVRLNNWMTAPLMAEIARRWISDGTGQELIKWQRQQARTRSELAISALDGFTLHADPAAFHVWLELPAPWRGDAFRLEAERKGVRLASGEAFVVGRDAAPHALRICTGGAKSADDVSRGLNIITGILHERPNSGFALV
ncbi:MAG: PLP-dependent aminotransferase family protein [Rhodospirillales bacterium]|nr:PLP-dependent aminotransferase family protein [Rhodospirillales bacterium]